MNIQNHEGPPRGAFWDARREVEIDRTGRVVICSFLNVVFNIVNIVLRQEHGFLTSCTWAVFCVYCSAAQIALFREMGGILNIADSYAGVFLDSTPLS